MVIGWATEAGYSYSWFDAVVRRPGNQTDLPVLPICSNRAADPRFFEQRVRWDFGSESRNRFWILSLRPGDIIGILPRAVYPQRVNIIREARIELEYEVDNSEAKAGFRGPMQENMGLRIAGVESGNVGVYARPLDSDRFEIRLLNIQPGAFDDPVKCNFHYTHLTGDDSPHSPFDGLSYCWGSSSDAAYILLDPEYDSGFGRSWNGHEFPVGRNVETALRRLRSDTKPLSIWVDAICINQDDLNERSGQVKIMRMIYSQATTVHIWLGEGDLLVDTAVCVAHNLYNHMYGDCPGGDKCQCTSIGISQHDVDTRDPENKRLQRANTSAQTLVDTFWETTKASFSPELNQVCDGWYNGELLAMMSVLYRHPWFTRVWVLQEAIFAEKAFIRCGTEAIPWSEIVAVSELLCQHRAKAPHLKWGGSLAPVWSQLLTSVRAQHNPNQRSRSPELSSPVPNSQSIGILDIFIGALGMKATDSRDKLFALLSFFPFADSSIDIESQPRELRSLIEPNYAKEIAVVLADFTKWWITTHKSLAILSYIHANPARAWRRMTKESPSLAGPRLPTWVIGTEGRNWWARATLESQFSFRATGTTKPSIHLDDDENRTLHNKQQSLKLRVEGVHVASISRIGHYPVEFLSPFLGERAFESDGRDDTIRAVFDRIFDPYACTSFWSLQENPIESPKNGADPAGLRSWYYSHLITHWAYHSRDNILAMAPSSDTRDVEIRWGLQETNKLPTCLNPCFFISHNGYHGLCPSTAQEGDIVVLLDGANVPYLLRPTGKGTIENEMETQTEEEFELVGECFVQGIMYGEFFEKQEAKERKLFSIV
ncbi:putative heterokaryon incompatibility protein [Rosellinia necatrix]|uniref:Putative heterokaryon incompatibility protein n=1 Tax=Rosellinia necatrix TaxID=77044 RepID=A0A1W2TWA5_ROSNE|nr:putative heterokaryon incompatibility protein [Rosellinia necatrix]